MGPIICDIEGVGLTSEDKDILMHPLVGGIILFARNYESREQLTALIASIRALSSEFLISVDQEGGRVQRLKSEFTLLPPLGSIGTMLDSALFEPSQVLDYAQYLGELMAREVQEVGIDISFAPVIDCNKGISQIIGDRAFHREPMSVSQLAMSYILGMGKAGMSATLKHFPGHGGVAPDSHLELPIDTRTLNEIKHDMLPFKYLIQKKINNIHAVMPAHIIYNQVDSVPAGFSRVWLQEILRAELGFKGAIISDDLSMKATAYLGDIATKATLALEAGCDTLLICNDRQSVESVLDSLKDNRSHESKQRMKKLLMTPVVECTVF